MKEKKRQKKKKGIKAGWPWRQRKQSNPSLLCLPLAEPK
jgi:hypothetical protein